MKHPHQTAANEAGQSRIHVVAITVEFLLPHEIHRSDGLIPDFRSTRELFLTAKPDRSVYCFSLAICMIAESVKQAFVSCHVLVSAPRQTLTPSEDIKNSNPQGVNTLFGGSAWLPEPLFGRRAF